MPGSKHNDLFIKKEGGGLTTSTNWSGGVQGGITNGQDIFFRIGFQSPATISQARKRLSTIVLQVHWPPVDVMSLASFPVQSLLPGLWQQSLFLINY